MMSGLSSIPPSLHGYSLEEQERLQQPEVNKYVNNLRHCLKTRANVLDGELVKVCALDCRVTTKCKQIEIWSIFRHNCKDINDVSKLHACFGILTKYGGNLLRLNTERPATWRTISVRNNTYNHKVDVVKGARDILNQFGYTETTDEGLSFPADAQPDIEQISRVLAEVHIVRAELELYLAREHQFPKHWESLIPATARLKQRIEGHLDTSQGNASELVKRFSKHIEDIAVPRTSGIEYNIGPTPTVRTSTLTAAPQSPYENLPGKKQTDKVCDICGVTAPEKKCTDCETNNLFCLQCDETFHKHPSRKDHYRRNYHASEDENPYYDMTRKGATIPNSRPPVQKQTSETENMYDSIASGEYATIGDVGIEVIRLPPQLPPRNNPGTPRTGTKFDYAEKCLDSVGHITMMPLPLNFAGGDVVRDVHPNNTATELVYGLISGEVDVTDVIMGLRQSPDNDDKQVKIQMYLSAIQCHLDRYAQGRKDNKSMEVEWQSLKRIHEMLEEYGLEISQKLEIATRPKPLQDKANTDTPGNVIGGRNDNRKWECEYRTTHNSLDKKICDTCYKTSDHPRIIEDIRKPVPRPRVLSDDVRPKNIDLDGYVMPSKNTPETHKMRETFSSPSIIDEQDHVYYEKQKAKQDFERSQRGLPPLSESDIQLEEKPAGITQAHHASSEPTRSHQLSEEQDEIYFEKRRAKKAYERKMRGEAVKEEDDADGNRGAAAAAKTGVVLHGVIDDQRYKEWAKENYERKKQGLPELPPLEGYEDLAQGKPGPNPQKLVGSRHEAEIRPKLTEKEKKHLRDSDLFQRQCSTQRQKAKEIIGVLKKAEKEKYIIEDIEIALTQTEPNYVFSWVENDLPVIIKKLLDGHKMSLPAHLHESTNQGIAKQALYECYGDFDLAFNMLIVRRNAVMKRLVESGPFQEDKVIRALIKCNGHEEQARIELQRDTLKDIRENIWRSVDCTGENWWAELDKVLRDKTLDKERRARIALVEGSLQGWGRAENAVKLMDGGNVAASARDIIEALKQRGDMQGACSLLQLECSMCYDTIPVSQAMVLQCDCRTCFQCLIVYFKIQIKEKHVKNLNCPACSQPDIEVASQETMYLEFLTQFLKGLFRSDPDTYDLYEMKLRDWNLMKKDNFRWCSKCTNGFLFEAYLAEDNPNRFRMLCNKCQNKTCFNCKKEWVDQHDGLTCEEFLKWQEKNDPEFQKEGLAKFLEESGIECTQCKSRYALAKGDCLHFKCPQCGFEFCCGCNGPFKQGAACEKYADCAKAGLHCHHPRDCLFYLRDNNIKELQQLLRHNDIEYDAKNKDNEKCTVQGQKETPDGLKDEACDRKVEANQAGLCKIHYKEYLVSQINMHKIDPVDLFPVVKLNIVYTQHKDKVPKQKKREKNNVYIKRLRKKEGLAKFLEESGIECTQCKSRYALAKGDCLHFKCPQCGFEFCCGCNGPFKQGAACEKYADCAKAGLHCHHPRDCLFYLRDNNIKELQHILRHNDIEYDAKNKDNEKCTVQGQKETPDGLKDEACDRKVEANQAGLCKIHYKEYLVSQINMHKIDPVDLFPVVKLNIVYTRHKDKVPKQKKREKNNVYIKRLRKDIKQRYPLPR